MNLFVQSLLIQFNTSTQTSLVINVPLEVKKITLKQMSVYNSTASVPMPPTATIKSDMVLGGVAQSLATLYLNGISEYTLVLNTTLLPISSTINGTYNFYLVAGEHGGYTSAANINTTVNLIVEFSG